MSCVRLLTAACAALLIAAGCRSTTAWTTVIDTGVEDSACAICTDGEDIYVVGSQTGGQTGRSVWVVQSLRRDGTLIRRFPFAEGSASVACDAVCDTQSNLYVCGRAQAGGANVCMLVRFRPTGQALWKKGFVLGEQSTGHGVCFLPGGRLAVCGAATAEGKTYALVAVFDTSGNRLWDRTYELGQFSEAWRIAADSDGNLAVTGRAGADVTPDLFVMKLNPKGDTVWTRRYDSGGEETPGGVCFGVLGYVLAASTARVRDSTRCVVLVWDSVGGPANQLAYGHGTLAAGTRIRATPDGEYFVAGRLILPRGSRVLAFQYIADATSVWEKNVAVGHEGIGADLLVDGDVYVCATVHRQTRDIAVLRLERGTVR